MVNPLQLLGKIQEEFLLDSRYILKELSKNNDDHAIFSKDGPNLIKPELTNKPSVIPNIYKLKNNIK